MGVIGSLLVADTFVQRLDQLQDEFLPAGGGEWSVSLLPGRL